MADASVHLQIQGIMWRQWNATCWVADLNVRSSLTGWWQFDNIFVFPCTNMGNIQYRYSDSFTSKRTQFSFRVGSRGGPCQHWWHINIFWCYGQWCAGHTLPAPVMSTNLTKWGAHRWSSYLHLSHSIQTEPTGKPIWTSTTPETTLPSVLAWTLLRIM